MHAYQSHCTRCKPERRGEKLTGKDDGTGAALAKKGSQWYVTNLSEVAKLTIALKKGAYTGQRSVIVSSFMGEKGD